MERGRSPLGEAWAWLAGLLLPIGGLASALALTLSGEPAGSPAPGPLLPTTLVAGASAQGPGQAPSQPDLTVARTATPRDSLGLDTPMVAAPVVELRPDVDVAGIQVQSPAAPLIGTVGAGPVSPVLPALALTLTVAGFAWRVHTSAPWPSRIPPRPNTPASPQTRSAPA